MLIAKEQRIRQVIRHTESIAEQLDEPDEADVVAQQFAASASTS
jgi:hypothetical protein